MPWEDDDDDDDEVEDDDDYDDGDDYDYGYSSGYWPTSGPRIRVKDGLKAKSQRGQIGETWWSGRFIRLLESFNVGGRLDRGRSYARTGQVMTLDLAPGIVAAKVQGSRRTPYQVAIRIPVIADKDWTRVEQAMASQAIFLARLLSGEMPNDIEEAFTACQLTLFPRNRGELKSACSCPDSSNPCKHIAATYYILAEQFDQDPFLIFKWRGRSREEIVERMRAARAAIAIAEETAPQSTGTAALTTVDLAVAIETGEPPLSECIENFWTAGPDLADLVINPVAAAVPDAVLRQLGPLKAEPNGGDIRELLAPFYTAMTEGAAKPS